MPPPPSPKHHAIRLVVATAIVAALMLVLLKMAVHYLNRDWILKQQRASAAQSAKASPATPAEVSPGRTYAWNANATKRQLRRLASGRFVANWWPIAARSLSNVPDSRLLVSSLYMAMAFKGESAGLRNELGVVYLQDRRMKEALAQFHAAEEIQPGFAPARFNSALCALSDRNPAQAIRFLGQYLGQRPEDVAALRLQTTLLAQLGQSREALGLLEKFLKAQPSEQPLFLEAAVLAARLGQNASALRYLETAMNGNSIQAVVRTYQSPAFRSIRLSGAGDPLAARMAEKARAAFSAPIPASEVQPLRTSAPEAKVR